MYYNWQHTFQKKSEKYVNLLLGFQIITQNVLFSFAQYQIIHFPLSQHREFGPFGSQASKINQMQR